MRYAVEFSSTARQQLAAIEEYISASADTDTAERYVRGIVDYCRGLATFPHRGARRDDLGRCLRVIGYRKRVAVIFGVDDDAQVVTIVGVFYGGQDYESALAD